MINKVWTASNCAGLNVVYSRTSRKQISFRTALGWDVCSGVEFNCVTVTGGGCKKCCSSLLLLLYSMKSIKSADNKREEMRGAKKVLF